MQSNIEELIVALNKLIEEMRDPPLANFMRFIFSPQRLLDKFLSSPASRSRHHSFIGGLATHSIGVAELVKKISEHYSAMGIKTNKDLLVAGALIHDIGKIHCYKWRDAYVETKSGPDYIEHIHHGPGYHHDARSALLHHIPMGAIDISKLADEFNNSRERDEHKLVDSKIDKLIHIILSHHGRKSWSSPVTPQFVEAYIIHSAEMMDAYISKFNDGQVPSNLYDH